ncbi:MAG: ABC transporter permease [Acidobacteria bacterium]|nr:ABC transporter permease [Acidobacteriota bacterium]
MSHSYWQRRFGGDPAILGKTVYLNGMAFTIIGVTPAETPAVKHLRNRSDITVPMAMVSKLFPKEYEGRWGLSSARTWWLQIIGRLKPEVSAAAAQADLTAILQRHVQEKEIRIRSDAQRVAPQIILVSGKQEMTELRRDILKGSLIPTLILGSVLLIACINLANLLLARTVARQKEIVVRLSLGAGRFRLIRQLLTENILLAGFGAALALPFVFWSQDALNWRVLGFTTAFSILTGILFGLAPALQATRVDLVPMLKVSEVGRGGSRSYLSKGLVVAQVAISLVLLIVAGLYVRTLRNLLQIDIGFNREGLLTFYVNPRKSGYEDARLASLYQRITESITGAPGVQAVTTTTNPLLNGSTEAVGQFDDE